MNRWMNEWMNSRLSWISFEVIRFNGFSIQINLIWMCYLNETKEWILVKGFLDFWMVRCKTFLRSWARSTCRMGKPNRTTIEFILLLNQEVNSQIVQIDSRLFSKLKNEILPATLLFWESRKCLNYLDDFLKKKPDRINEYIIWNVAGKFPNRVHVSKPSPWPQFVPANRQVCQRRKWTEVSYKGGDTVTSPQNCSSSSKSIPFE